VCDGLSRPSNRGLLVANREHPCVSENGRVLAVDSALRVTTDPCERQLSSCGRHPEFCE
jgi:hypothetical protein